MDFGAAPVGTAAFRVVLAVSNPSPLPVAWRFSFRSELEAYYSLKREAWMTMSMMDDEVSDNMKRQKWMVENKIFRIKPKSGNLAPGATAFVEISYSHTMITDSASTDGYDELPVYFEVVNGRQAVVCLRGKTLAPLERYLHFATSSHSFAPIPIGIRESPIQPYQLYNHGAVDVDFSFDLSAVEKMKKENFNFSVFECLTESGHIPAGGQFTTYWRFTPLEIKDYECRVALNTKSGPTAHILFRGHGYHPTGSDFEVSELLMPALPPPQPQLTMESQPVTLSLELLDLGTIPTFSLTRRLVVLHNTSLTHSASFSWSSISSILYSSFTTNRSPPAVEVSPESGILLPGEKRACCVVMRPNSHVGLLELEIPCKITSASPIASSSSPSPSPPISNPSPSSAPSRTTKLKETTTKKEGMFPPLVPPPRPTPPAQSSPTPPHSHSPQFTNGTISQSSVSSNTPTSTSTSTLFLIIQARTVQTELYRHLQGNYAMIHTPYPPKSRLTQPNYKQKPQTLPLTTEEAGSLHPIASSFLSSLISEILADPDVQEEARQHDDDDLIPFFEQLRDESELPYQDAVGDELEKEKAKEKEKEKEKEHKPHRIEKSNSDNTISDSLRNLYATKSLPTTPKRRKGLPEIETTKQKKFESVSDVYKDAEFAEVTEYILEATIYNLMNEVLHSEFSLDEPPAVVFQTTADLQ